MESSQRLLHPPHGNHGAAAPEVAVQERLEGVRACAIGCGSARVAVLTRSSSGGRCGAATAPKSPGEHDGAQAARADLGQVPPARGAADAAWLR